jgi:uncharacterized protein YggE
LIMRTTLLTGLAVIFASTAFAQLDPFTITISASRSIYVQPDQVVMGVVVNTSLATTLDQVVAATPGVGITAGNLRRVSTRPDPNAPALGLPGSLDWNFYFVTSFASLKDTMAQLSDLQRSVASGNPGMTLTFSVVTDQASPQTLAAQPCRTAELIADAHAKALKLANAAGFGLGSVVAMSDLNSGQSISAFVIAGVVPSFPAVASTTPMTCALSVKFRLLQF